VNRSSTGAAWDIVGDVHGHCDELVALLRALGYHERRGVWRHPERIAVFVGDFLDRGPQIRETLALVRSMLEAGSALAVLGNHEWNAFALATPDPDAPGEFLRRRTERNLTQVAATHGQVPAGELQSHLAFLRQLPVRLDLPGGARVVHACWDDVAQAVIDEAWLRHGGLTDDFLVEGSNAESLLYAALEIALKGKEMELPPGAALVDRGGQRRHRARVRWYAAPEGHTVASYALPAYTHLPLTPLPRKVVAEARPYPAEAPPVFFGHYWLADPAPAPLARNIACLDYSVAGGGFLCAYRHDGEATIDGVRFVTTSAAR
jgi:hypothetical protein